VTGVPPAPTMQWSIGLSCLNYFGDASCSNNHSTGYTYSVEEWSVPHTFTFLFNTSNSKGGGDKYHNAADGLNYHAMSQWQMFPGNARSRSWSNATYFRCDRARYITKSGGGCVFFQVMPTWQISRSGNAAAVAKHIELALIKPGTGTYPPAPAGKKVVIPGSAATGRPLRRLYANYDEALYNANRTVAINACIAKWGSGYAHGGKYDCDEYPMAGTYQGAATANGNPLWYSVLPVPSSANRSAGGSWSAFLVANHVLSGDLFWVAVVS
jgi:hypothetical protein